MSAKVFIEQFLKQELKLHIPKHQFSEIYSYALFPAGKLIRSQLLLNVAKDLGNKAKENNLLLACAFIEYHHAYTLMHDDLPCMDNDDYRRGKPSSHKAYGEWQALLAGDGLLNASYSTLAKIKSPHINTLLRFATAFTGPKGLILGQVLDLSHEMNDNFSKLVKTHELKTARLFQLSFLFPYYLGLEGKADMKKVWSLTKLGRDLGIYFQLLDDLSELTEKNLSEHELSVNPFLKQRETAIEAFKRYSLAVNKSLTHYPHTQKFLNQELIEKSLMKLTANADTLLLHQIDSKKLF